MGRRHRDRPGSTALSVPKLQTRIEPEDVLLADSRIIAHQAAGTARNGHAVGMSGELVGGVAGGSAQRKYEDLSRSWRRSMRKQFWVIGGVMAPIVAALAAMGVIWENLRWASGFLIGCFFAMFMILRMSPPGWIENWQDGAWGEQWTGKELHPLERQGWVVLHDLTLGRAILITS